MSDTTFISRVTTVDTLKHLTVTTTHTTTKHHQAQSFLDSNTFKVFFPLCFTLLVFFLGQVLAVYFKKRDRRTQLQNSKANLETWVLQLERTAKTLVAHCQTFSKTLNEQKEIQRVTLGYTPTLISKISELDVNEFLNYSTLNLEGSSEENAKRAFEIMSNIEYLKAVETDIQSQYQKFLDSVDLLLEDLMKGNKDLAKAQTALVNEVGSNKEHIAYNFQRNILGHLTAWYASGSSHLNIIEYEQKFITPYIALVKEELGRNPQNIQTGIFVEKIHAMRVAIEKWKVLQNGYSTLIKDYADGYRDAFDDLKRCTIELKGKDLVTVWNIK